VASEIDDSAPAAQGPPWRQAHGLLEAMDSLWSTDDPAAFAQLTVAEAARLLPGLIVAIAMVPPGSDDRLHVVAGTEDWCAKELPVEGSIAGLALRNGVAVERPPSDSVDSSRLVGHGVRLMRAVPLVPPKAPGSALTGSASLLFMTRGDGGFQPEQRQLMDEFARLAGLALERTQLLAQARESAASLQKAFDVAVALAAGRSHRDVMDALLQKAVEALDAERATLSSIDQDRITVQANYSRHGAELTWIGRSYSLDYLEGQPHVKEALATMRPVIGGQLDASAAAPEFKEAIAAVRHTLTLPLVHGDELEAMLVLSRADDHPFSASDVVTAQLIGSAAMLALRNARLYDETEKARAATEALVQAQRVGIESALDVASELTLGDIVSRVVRRAAEVAHADRCVLLSVAEERAIVEGSYGSAGGELIPAGSSMVVAEQPLLVRAFESGLAAQGPEVNLEPLGPEVREELSALGWFATIPLQLAGRPVGALNLSRYRPEPFTPEELTALTQIGQITALAVRNARLFEELELASRSKTEFLNLAAHELRTPISVIKGYISLILEGSLADLPEAMVQPLKVVQEKATELNRTVEDLLAAARVQAGTLTANRGQVDLRSVVEHSAARVGPAITLAGGRLDVALPGAPVVVDCDETHLERILDNLLNNAVAYSVGAPRVAIRLARSAGAARVEVEDHGRGIPAGERERIFDQFVRVENPAYGYTPGTGLGLYISRGLARQNGGTVELVRSAPGAGSTFALVLPLLHG
jgi:signal transduction histidine kinase